MFTEFTRLSSVSILGSEKEGSADRGAACDWSEFAVPETLHRVPGSARIAAYQIALHLWPFDVSPQPSS